MPAFIPDISIIVTFALASTVLAITPGPDMALFIARTINYGRSHGIAAILGAVTGLMVHIGLAAFGISVLLASAPTAFFALKIASALYLLWLAIQAIQQNGGIVIARTTQKWHCFSSLSFPNSFPTQTPTPWENIFLRW